VTSTRNIRTGLRAVIALAALAAAFALPAQAFAGDNCSNVGSDPTQAQYCSPSAVHTGGGSTSTPSASGTSSASTSSGGGSLPFTGLDLAALLAVAAVLTATGLALRRLSAPGGGRH
jgi:hypothetical protein